MKTKLFITILTVVFASGVVGAFGTNTIYTSANNVTKNVHVRLISAAYSNDHVAVEYSVEGQITTSEGVLSGCPVGGASILNGSAQVFRGSDVDFIDCRPDGANKGTPTICGT